MSMSGLTTAIGTGTKATSLAGSAWDLGKDIFNIDTKRQVGASYDIMSRQNQYNKENFELQKDFNREMFAKQFDAIKDLQSDQNLFNAEQSELAYRRNLDSMDKQFALNAILSSPGRQLQGLRSSGVNPKAMNGVGSVSGPSNPSASGSTPSAPQSLGATPSSPSPASVSGSKYSPASAAAAAAASAQYEGVQNQKPLIDSQVQKTNQDAENIRLKNLTEVHTAIAKIGVMKSEIEKNIATSKNQNASSKVLLDTLDAKLKVLDAEEKNLLAQGAAATKNADTNARNAASKEKEVTIADRAQREAARHNAVTELFQEEGLTLESDKVNATVNLFNAMADKATAEGKFTDEQRKMFVEKVTADINLNKAQEQLARENAKRLNITHEQAVRDIKSQIAERIWNGLLQTLTAPAKYIPLAGE